MPMQQARENLLPGDERLLPFLSIQEKAQAAADLIKSIKQVQQIILYGSLGKEEGTTESDIDLTIVIEDDIFEDERELITSLLKQVGITIGNGNGEVHLNILTTDEQRRMKQGGSGKKLLEEYREGKTLYLKDKSTLDTP